MKQVTATVVSRGERIPGISRPHGQSICFSQTIKLNCPEIAREAQPGQFVMVRCEGCVLPRPFSIHQVIDKEDIILYFAVLDGGRGTGWLSQRQVGDTVDIFPRPLGNRFSIYPSSHNLLLAAGGMGIAPLLFLAQEALVKGCSVTLLYGTANEYGYSEPIPLGIKLVRVSENGAIGKRGIIINLMPDYINEADQIFACGPMPMYRAMAQMPELKDKPVQISLEVKMGCGLGVCYGCTVKTKNGLKQVCTHGPIFDLDDILWDEIT